ncbi:MAG: tRNA (adenosine(37)-N6)-dimethylallyltransferase MiaA [Granulosicoccus sp.]
MIFLMGATACGKTELSLLLARELNAEIISVDSALVYRGLNIGTAKPNLAEREAIPHHLIDICDPWQSYSAALFCDDAHRLISEIQARGRKALLVGGTMLYFRSLQQGLASLPDADHSIRQDLQKAAVVAGWDSLHRQLAQVDPMAARRIHPNDPQRIMRALEVFRITGKPLSELQSSTRGRLSVPPVKFALMPDERSWLHQRIERRFRLMLHNGFLTELQGLYDHPLITSDQPAMRSVGYRQAWEHIESGSEGDQWVEKAIAATRQLAKRQLTWLRGMADLHTIACDRLTPEQQLSDILCNLSSHP